MACKLYYKYGPNDYSLGTFKDKKQAERYWSLVRPALENKLGTGLEPIYVESGKGRGKQ